MDNSFWEVSSVMIDINLLIEKYLREFPAEKERLGGLLEFIDKSDNPSEYTSKDSVKGHITASGFVVSADRRRVLRLHHRKLDFELQPGGHIEPVDESPLQAAIREVNEETSLRSIDHIAYHADVNVPIDIDTHTIPKYEATAEHTHFDFRYLFICKNEDEFVLNKEEFSESRWHNTGELLKHDTFATLKPKIERALSNEFRSKLFFDRMIEATIPAKTIKSIVVSHIVPDAKVYLLAINEVAPIAVSVPKPRSLNEQTAHELSQTFKIEKLDRGQIGSNPSIIGEYIAASESPVILFDIGGYFARVLNQLTQDYPGKILGVIEDTENGHQKYKDAGEFSVPVLSVARSPLKQNEDFLVGQSILFSADSILREVGFNIEYKACAVFGWGKIGRSIAHHLLMRGVKPLVHDINPMLRIGASNQMCHTPGSEYILKTADVIFCATGNKVLGTEEFSKLKPGCIVCSVTSSDDELDLSDLELYHQESISDHVTKYSSFGNYFYLVNEGNAANFVHTAALGSYIHLVRAEMLHSLSILSSDEYAANLSRLPDGLYELNEEARNRVAEAWLEVYAEVQPTHTDLGVAG